MTVDECLEHFFETGCVMYDNPDHPETLMLMHHQRDVFVFVDAPTNKEITDIHKLVELEESSMWFAY